MRKIIFILGLLILTSCVSAKKSWVTENFTSKTETERLSQSVISTTESIKSEINENIEKRFQENSVTSTETINETSTTSTTVEGSIDAEEGKEKTVTIGGTTITSNGANITFKSSQDNVSTKEMSSQIKEITSLYQEQMQRTEEIEKRYEALKLEIEKIKSETQSELEIRTKEIKRKGMTLGTVGIGILILIIVGTVIYFKKMIPLKL